jgi:hypothetical protein
MFLEPPCIRKHHHSTYNQFIVKTWPQSPLILLLPTIAKPKEKMKKKTNILALNSMVPLNKIDKLCEIGSHSLSLKPNTELENTN